jgi:hypothetical protein
MMYPICNIYFQIKGQNSSKRSQNGMKFYHILEMLQSKFQFDMWKWNEIISRKPERMDGWTDIDITEPEYVLFKD